MEDELFEAYQLLASALIYIYKRDGVPQDRAHIYHKIAEFIGQEGGE